MDIGLVKKEFNYNTNMRKKIYHNARCNAEKQLL